MDGVLLLVEMCGQYESEASDTFFEWGDLKPSYVTVSVNTTSAPSATSLC